MNLDKRQHLCEEAFNDLLIGLSAPEAEAHLAACEECRAQLAAFRSDLALFNQATLAWSESKTAAMPPLRRKPRFVPSHPLAWSAATAVLLLVGVAGWNSQRAPLLPTESAPSIATEFADSPDQIAEDNQLLHNVYDALDDEPVNDFSIVNGASSVDAPSEARTQ
ncbi:MAG TPA: hypothetical protein VL346_02080 [Acidobacteriaceae bacterium]|nr:hypothetical protein [Acidobacteriaceae bacterium]